MLFVNCTKKLKWELRKIASQRKIILSLEANFLKLEDDLKTLKDTCEQSQEECCETQTSISWMKFASCEHCPILYQEISSLK